MYILLLKMLHYFHGKIVAKVFITCCAVYVQCLTSSPANFTKEKSI